MTEPAAESGALTERQVQDIAVAIAALNAGRIDGPQTVASIVAQVDHILADLLADPTEAEAEAVDQAMSDHMYGHSISNSYASFACDGRCRTRALSEAFRRCVLVPRRTAISSGQPDGGTA